MKKMLALALVLLLVGCAARSEKYLVSGAVYPEMAPCPQPSDYIKPSGYHDDDAYHKVHDPWLADRNRQRNQPEGYAQVPQTYLTDAIASFFDRSDETNPPYNRVLAPVNTYIALAMLAEVTDSETREEILSAVHIDTLETLRDNAHAVWMANYCDDGALKSIPASSLWLSDTLRYREETIAALSENYFASVYQGRMGDPDYDRALRDWIDTQTGGLLQESSKNVYLDPLTAFSLVTTSAYQAHWTAKFSPSATENGSFHGVEGDVECAYMKQSGDRSYYWSDRFAAIGLSLRGSGTMWLLLPDEGVDASSLLADGDGTAFLLCGGENTPDKRVIVHLSLPKFDISCDGTLDASWQSLGIQRVFGASADFSPMLADGNASFPEPITLGKVQHAARVAIDEDGVTAAAYTLETLYGAAPPPDEEVDFVLDRPFVFGITSHDGLPLFVGVVDRP